MSKFNPLDYPISLLSPPCIEPGANVAHIPFVMTLIDLLRPRVIVDVNATDAVFYGAFCEAVRQLQLDTRCFFVKTGASEDYAQANAAVLDRFKQAQYNLYREFSEMLAADQVEGVLQDARIDLLHIGIGPFSANVSDDFESWLPRLSDRGVLVLDETNSVELSDRLRFWQKIKASAPHFEFAHEFGLGAAALGKEVPDRFRDLTEAREPEASLIREFYCRQGNALALQINHTDSTDREAEMKGKDQTIQSLTDALEARARKMDILEQQLAETSSGLDHTDLRLTAILNSRAWRWVSRYGRLKNRVVELAHQVRLRELPETTDTSRPAETQYDVWIQRYDTLNDEDRAAILARCKSLRYKPLISVVMPVYDVPEVWLRAAIESVRRQLYPYWELCIADDHSSNPYIATTLNEYAQQDPRIKVTFRSVNGHIAAASNSALHLATGEFVAFLDHDDELTEHALYMIVEELNAHPEADLIYSDDDKISAQGKRFDPQFKGCWNPDLFYAMNFLAHLGVYRASMLRKIGGFRTGYEGSQDYDLALRVIERIPSSHIRHVPHILYHWRAVPGSVALRPQEKLYAHEAARKAIRSHFERTGARASIMPGYGHYHRVLYSLPPELPLVSLIVGTRDGLDLLRQATIGILEQTDYERIELIIVDNQSRDAETLAFLEEIQASGNVRVISYDAPFNFSAINNLGAREAHGEIIGFINSDIRVISRSWLKEMVRHAARPEVGAVGAKLYYPNDTIQHAGIIIGLGGIAGHPFRGLGMNESGYFARPHVIQNVSAVTGACLVMRRRLFDQVGGFDEVQLPIAYNDVDLCLRLRQLGYLIVWTPHAELYHIESASRGYEDSAEKQERLKREANVIRQRWGDRFFPDPYYSQNFTLHEEDYSLAFPPRRPHPWKKNIDSELPVSAN